MSSVKFMSGDFKNITTEKIREIGAQPADVLFDKVTGTLYFLTKNWELYPLFSCCEVGEEKTDLKIEEGFEKLDLKSSLAYRRAMEGLL